MQQESILNRLDNFQIGQADADLSFSRRLARENAWSLDYAERVIIEYKRFIYLVCVMDEEMTPSDQVDQAWHLHLTYTHSYWKQMCGELLGCEIHHNPTRGGGAQQQKFERQYRDTLRRYEEIFGHPPPAEIWPDVKRRFEGVSEFVRINRLQQWVISKPSIAVENLLLLLAVPLILIACSDDRESSGFLYGILVLLLAYIGLRLCIWLYRVMNAGGRSRGGGGCGAGGGDCGGGGCGGCGG